MLLDEIKSVLSFAAFKADPDDSGVPWAKRYEGRKSLLMNVSRGFVSWRSVNKRGRFEEGGMMEGEFADAAPSAATSGVAWWKEAGAPFPSITALSSAWRTTSCVVTTA